jgi:hypothetical protein
MRSALSRCHRVIRSKRLPSSKQHRRAREDHHDHSRPGTRLHYLAIKDDGDGVPRDSEGLPDIKYVATHICDSIKRHLKADGNGAGLQGEFGIGLLSFWTVGNRLTMISTGTDQRLSNVSAGSVRASAGTLYPSTRGRCGRTLKRRTISGGRYDEITPILLKQRQAQNAKIASLEAQFAQLRASLQETKDVGLAMASR